MTNKDGAIHIEPAIILILHKTCKELGMTHNIKKPDVKYSESLIKVISVYVNVQHESDIEIAYINFEGKAPSKM